MEPVIKTINSVDRAWETVKGGCIWVILNLLWIGLALGAYYYGRTSWQLTREGGTVTGSVVGLKESAATQDSGVTYTPIISYEVDGRPYTFTSNVSSDPPAYRVGESVDVLYELHNPSRARVDSWGELWMLPVILGASAVIVAVIVNTVFLVALVKKLH